MGVNIGPPTADFTFTPSSPTNLDVIKFTDISTDSDGTIIYWNWNFDDGNFSTQQNPSHTYTNKGTYTVSLTITNNNGIEENQSHAVVVIVDTEDPSTVTGLSVIDAKDGKLNLAWNAATDNIAVNHYKIYRNNVFLLNRTTTSYQDTELTNGQSYSYQVSAVDSSGNEGNLSTSVSGTPTKSSGGGGTTPTEPENKKPIANASAGKPYHGLVNSEIIFNGSGSSDSDGTITKWFWDFGDNTTGTGKTVTHTFSQAGNYTVTITVTDDDGATNTDTTICMISQNITQPNRPPTKPMIIGTTVGSTNTRYTYTVVSKDPDNDTIQYTFDWGEPTNQSSGFLPNGTSYSVNHSWTTPGQYILTVTVTDNQTEAFSSMTININAVEKKPSTPGFELVFVIGAIAVAMFLLRKKRSV
jgi:PKD repeat protein